MNWEDLERACLNCRGCALAEKRTNVVIGKGCRTAPILFVGEGPGENEDLQGVPFVGAAGQLLDLALVSAGYAPEDYYIANVVKCRPPHNRTPAEEECNACIGYLRGQFALIRPKIVVCLGSVASNYLIEKNFKITRMRGIWKEKKGVWFMPTYHPAALLRDESKKLDMWKDIKAAHDRLQELKAEGLV